MNKKLIGVILLVGGGILGYMGYQEKESAGSELRELVEDKPTDKAMMLLGGGVLAILAGGALVLKGGGKPKK